MWQIIDYYTPQDKNGADRSRGELWLACVPRAISENQVTRVFESGATARLSVSSLGALDGATAARASAKGIPALTLHDVRPVLLLSSPAKRYVDRAWTGGCWHLVAPIRSLKDPDTGEYKAEAAFLWGVITYVYPSLFYLPEDAGFQIREAVVHFDRLTTLHTSWLLEPRRARLTDAALRCADQWLGMYLTGKCSTRFSSDVGAYREMMGESPNVRGSLGLDA